MLATVRDAALAALVKRPEGGEFTGALGGGLTGLAVLDLSLPRNAPLPRNLVHRLTISFDPNSVPPGFPSPVPYLTGRTHVSRHQPVTVAPPLRGPGWVAVNGCCNAANSHRGGIVLIDGNLRAVERFAIDFVQLGPDRRLFVGPLENLSSYRYFGADVRSVADGTVVRTHDGEPEQTPPNGPADFPTPQTAGGNYARGRHRRGPLRVLRAPAARQPQREGRVTGEDRDQSSACWATPATPTAPPALPHHGRPVAVASNGLPFRVHVFTGPGKVTDENTMFQGAPTPISSLLAGPHRRQLPLDLQVVNFD